jgi:pyridoxamine 5'-phosphate oxidase
MSDLAPTEHLTWLTLGDAGAEPVELFASWLREAAASEPADPNAMALATVDPDGLPNVRMVLLKGLDHGGFVFYTNLASQKGRELDGNPSAALVFHWKSLARQVRVRGPVEPVAEAEADAYFDTRPRLAQIGAWASRQSAPLESRLILEKAVAAYAAKYAIGSIPRPPNWGGFRIKPLEIEFWRDRPFRLHERIQFRRARLDRPWAKTLLYP